MQGKRQPGRKAWRRRIATWPENQRWWLLVALALITLMLGMVGFADSRSPADWESPQDLLYLSLQLFVLESGAVRPPVPWTLDIARLLAAAVTGLATAGLLTKLIHELRAVAVGRNTGRRQGHVIICGLGKKGKRLADEFAGMGMEVVAIDAATDVHLERSASGARRTLLRGDAADGELLRKAGLKGANRLIAVCGDDGKNAEIALSARAKAGDKDDPRETPLPTLIHIADRELKDLLGPLVNSSSDKLDAKLVNVYEDGARAMLDRHPPFPHEDRSGSPILVIGLGEVGQCLVVQAAREWEASGTPIPLKCFVMDCKAKEKTAALQARHHGMRGRWDLVPLEEDITCHEFEDAEWLTRVAHAREVACVYICIDNDPLALTTALTIRKALGEGPPPIKVRTAYGRAGLAAVLLEQDGQRSTFADIYPFGLLDEVCTPETFSIEKG